MTLTIEELNLGQLAIMDKTEIENELNADVIDSFDEEDEMTKEEFSYFLINMREALGVTQSKMAELLGCNQNAFNAYEKAKRLPKKWHEIQVKVQKLVKEHREANRGIEFKQHINNDLLSQIVELHNKGKNHVQIGIHLDLDEDLVIAELLKAGYEPLLFTLS